MASPRGFIALPLMGWIAIGLSIAFLGLGTYAKTVAGQRDRARAELAICATQYKQALESIQRQNEAVEKTLKAAKDAQKRAKAATERVKATQIASRTERQRLEAEYAQMAKTVCPAGEAVSEIKKGLK